MEGLLFTLFFILLGFFIGRMKERAHFARLQKEEAELEHIIALNIKSLPNGISPGGTLVTGNVVIALDYFKKIIANLKMIIGGKLGMYDSLLERARREAIVRMKKEANELGANAIYNVRIEFSAIGMQPNAIGGTELLAYGTAVKYSNAGPVQSN